MELLTQTMRTRGKLLFKTAIIGFLVLLLLIPAFAVQNLVEEREARAQEVVKEVSSKWASDQNVVGPVLVLPYATTETDSAGKKATFLSKAYLLPDSLQVRASMQPHQRSRGIFNVMLYSSHIALTGSFNRFTLEQLKIPPQNMRWQDAHLQMNLTDARGLNDELKLTLNGMLLPLTPEQETGNTITFTSPLPIDTVRRGEPLSFAASFNLNGSQKLEFTPVGKVTTVAITAPWPNPSFTGAMLPQNTQITKDSFTATWKSLAHNRAVPQRFTGSSFSQEQLQQSAFGVNLLIPVNGYQKTMRSVKYAVLCILLTFAAFFLIETVHNRSVHPLQYGLIGLALILFYMLLLSISEYTGFNIAYAIAALATIALIGWFVKGLLASGRLSSYLSLLLLLVYLYGLMRPGK